MCIKITAVHNFIKSRFPAKNYGYIFGFWFIIFFYRGIFYFTTTPYKSFPDTDGYINWFFENGRTPVYPMIIRFLEKIFGKDYYLEALIFLQILVSFVALVYMKKIISLLVKKKVLVYILTGLYGVNSSIMGWDKALLTESLALSFLVITIYYVLKYIQNHKTVYANCAIALSLIAVFQRPTSLLYFIIFSIFFVMFNWLKKIKNWKVVIGILAGWLILLAYCSFFYTKFEIFSITNSLPRQQLITVMTNGYYKTSENSEIVEAIEQELEESNGDIWAAMWPVLNTFGNKTIADFSKDCIKNNMSNYILDRLQKMYADINSDFITTYYDYKYDISNNKIMAFTNVAI